MEHWDLTRVHEANLKLLKETAYLPEIARCSQ